MSVAAVKAGTSSSWTMNRARAIEVTRDLNRFETANWYLLVSLTRVGQLLVLAG